MIDNRMGNMAGGASGRLEEYRDAQTLSYVLPNENLFFATGYRVLQNQEKNGFLHCAKMSQNGRTTLSYQIYNVKPLDMMMDIMTPNDFIAVLASLFQTVVELKSNGFMQCENVELDINKIFVDEINYKAYLVYIPIVCEQTVNSFVAFEARLGGMLTAAIARKEQIRNPEVMSIYRMLNDRTPVDVILSQINSGQFQHSQQQPQMPQYGNSQPSTTPPPMYTASANTPSGYGMPITGQADPMYPAQNTPQHAKKNKSGSKVKMISIISLWVLVAAGIGAAYYFEWISRKWELLIYLGIILVGTIISLLIGMIAPKGDKVPKYPKAQKAPKAPKVPKAPKSSRAQKNQEMLNIPPAQQQNQPQAYDSAFNSGGNSARAYPQPENIPMKPPSFTPNYQDDKTEISGVDDIYGETEVLSEFIPRMILRGINTPMPVELAITQSEFVIGKNPKAVNGVLSFSKAISRIHCKISCVGERYFITDLGSSNFTYVNGIKLEAKKPTEIQQNDSIRIADFDFSFSEM